MAAACHHAKRNAPWLIQKKKVTSLSRLIAYSIAMQKEREKEEYERYGMNCFYFYATLISELDWTVYRSGLTVQNGPLGFSIKF